MSPRVTLLLLVAVAGCAQNAAAPKVVAPELSSELQAQLALCPLDAGACMVVSERVPLSALDPLCEGGDQGACAAAAFTRVETAPGRRALAAAFGRLSELCSAGLHAACSLRMHHHPEQHVAVRLEPTRVMRPSAAGLGGWPAEPDHARLDAACDAGEPLACAIVDRSLQLSRYRSALARAAARGSWDARFQVAPLCSGRKDLPACSTAVDADYRGARRKRLSSSELFDVPVDLAEAERRCRAFDSPACAVLVSNGESVRSRTKDDAVLKSACDEVAHVCSQVVCLEPSLTSCDADAAQMRGYELSCLFTGDLNTCWKVAKWYRNRPGAKGGPDLAEARHFAEVTCRLELAAARPPDGGWPARVRCDRASEFFGDPVTVEPDR